MLVSVVLWMARSQMSIWVPFPKRASCGARPVRVTVGVKIIPEVPRDVREGAETGDGIADEPVLIRAAGCRVSQAVGHVQHEREDDVPFPGETQRTLELLPVGQGGIE